MDSNHQELDLPEDDSSLGIGRSYECVFCKRGFNTAQALGGHMNIHRKDRARNKPAAKHEEIRRSYHQVPSYIQPHYVSSHEPQFNYLSYFPASSSPAQPFYASHHYMKNINDCNPQRFNPFGLDQWSMGLNLPCGASSAHVGDLEKTRRVGGQEEELDLELRLGP